MYSQTEALVDFLFQWRCGKSKFFECVLDLSEQMADRAFWSRDEVRNVGLWLSDLGASGYTEPDIVNFENGTMNQSGPCGSQEFQEISRVRAFFFFQVTN